MKKKTWFFPALLFISFVLLIMHATDAVAEYRIEFSNTLIREMKKQGRSLPKYSGHYCTKSECQAALQAMSTQGFNFYGTDARCVGSPCSGGGSGGGMPLGGLGGSVGSEQFAKDMVMNMGINLIGMMIENAINPQQNNAAAAAAAEAHRKALAKKKAEEDRKRRQLLYNNLNKDYQSQREEAYKDLGDMLGGDPYDSPGLGSAGGGSLDGFLGVLENELQPRGTANYDTSALSLSDRLRCAAYFSNKASAAAGRGDHVNARYMNEQAQKAMLGQITDEECQFADMPDVPEPPKPQIQEIQKEMEFYKDMLITVQQDVKKLQDIDIKLKETDEKIKQAEEKKQQAEEKITELQNRAASADKPEEKQECDDLLAQARQLEQEAQQQIQAAIDDKQNYVNEKENITNKLKEVQKSMQQSSGSD
jgi:hypothetical protein